MGEALLGHLLQTRPTESPGLPYPTWRDGLPELDYQVSVEIAASDWGHEGDQDVPTPEDYHARWRRPFRAPLTVPPGADFLADLLRLSDCWLHLYGPVGLLWYIPMAYCLYVEPVRWGELAFAWREVDCDPSPQGVRAGARRLCPVLATDCAVEVFHLISAEDDVEHLWRFGGYLGDLQSRTLLDAPADARIAGLRLKCHSSFDFERDDGMELLVLVVAGVAMATCKLLRNPGGLQCWHLEELTACTRRGAGGRLVAHVQAMCVEAMGEQAKIVLISLNDRFYEQLGFRKPHANTGRMEWTVQRPSEEGNPKRPKTTRDGGGSTTV